VALAENPNAVQPSVTWLFTEDENGKREYEWGHYTTEKHKAEGDFHTRKVEYQHQYGVAVVSIFPPMELYNYFSTQRPVDIGTFPKTLNGPLSFVNFDERLPVEGGAFRAWGILTYSAPLAEKQIYDYELRAAKDNPDRQQTTPSIAAQLAEGAKQAAHDNATRPMPDKSADKDR
jgi:hypothetical protein